MPPPDKGDPSSAEDIALLEKWIDAGAEHAGHWAFEKPVMLQSISAALLR